MIKVYAEGLDLFLQYRRLLISRQFTIAEFQPRISSSLYKNQQVSFKDFDHFLVNKKTKIVCYFKGPT